MKHNKLYQILFQDDDIIVVDKASGVLSIPDRFDKNIPNLRMLLEEKFGRIWVVHRLDKETSGIMVFARNAKSHKDLNTQFEELNVEKIYHAFVSGWVAEDEFDIDIPLLTDPSNKGRTIPSARGKEALTKVRVLERFSIATLIECNLVTGRHHQIRVHCATVGNPLLVDDIYGKNEAFFLSHIKRRYNLKKGEEEKPIIDRLTLHAYSLKFRHPKTQEIVEFTAQYPKDFSALLNVLRKYSK
ncbi:RluA family pseudouridine synthase [Bacteroidetes/Chlorobi group bacterium Naka2016]|jgi:23S rRNA pseudouridine955/2504/2580 synthase/23S rRNA pseudouridine1911/1915/1917 synthase|nr:MAG: RluA family pseudouridine synthase [Bacteroidetes/Chlorobi group bacterium Naka2016]